MSNIVFNVCQRRVGFPTLKRLMVYSLVLAGISGLSTAVYALGTKQAGDSAPQFEALQNLQAVNRAQEAYHRRRGRFASRLSQLRVNIPAETETYRYRIVPQADYTKSVRMTAQAKRSTLRSYTGAVLLVTIDGQSTTQSAICETNIPSSSPPDMPKPPSNFNTEYAAISCPLGSHLLRP